MANHSRNKQITKDSGGSFTPKKAVAPHKYVLKEKVSEMLKYALPRIDAFPARNKVLAGFLRRSALTLYRLAVTLDYVEDKQPTAAALVSEFAVLKEFIVLASDKDYFTGKYAPPLSLHEREVWGRYNVDIGLLIEGLKQA